MTTDLPNDVFRPVFAVVDEDGTLHDPAGRKREKTQDGVG